MSDSPITAERYNRKCTEKLFIACKALVRIIELGEQHSAQMGDDRGPEMAAIAENALNIIDPTGSSPFRKAKQ